MMKAFCAVTAMTMAGSSMAATAAEPSAATHRYLIERTFPAGALDGVDAAAKKKVNENNATLNVTWEKSYANADKTKTYCVYDGPSEAAVREAAKLNGLPVDNVTEIPADIKAEPRGAVQHIASGNQRYLVKRSGAPDVHGQQRQEVRRDADHLVRHRGQAAIRSGCTKRRASRRWRVRPRRAARRSSRSRRFPRRCTRTEVLGTSCPETLS